MALTAVITGGAGGIGSAAAALLAERGYNVAVLYKNSRSAAEGLAAELSATPVYCDVTDPASCADALKAVFERYMSVDLLVNCAGSSLIRTIGDTTDADYAEIFAVNMGGVFNMTRAALPYFLKNHSGSIVNISSMWGIAGASCETVYSAAKAGVIGFTKASAKELAPSGITVNCVAPGVIDTRMNGGLSPETRLELAEMTPLGRFGRPDEVAAAVLFFAENAFITGQTLAVDGGFTL